MLENMQDIPLQSSHEVGVDALGLEILNGFVSSIKSIYECQKKGKDHKEAFKHTIKTTLENGVHSYGIAFGGSLLGDMIQNNPNKFIQSFGNGSVPTMIVGVGVVNCKVLVDYFRGKRREIDRVECLEKLVEMYQNQFNEVFERYFHGTIKFFNESFDEMERALCAGDADLAIEVNNKIQEGMGQELLFDNKQECWEFITSRKEGWNFITSRGETEI